MTHDPKFLLIRFNEGAAGKFLMSLLMGSSSVAHYDPTVEQNKNNQSLLNYVQRSFQTLDQWVATEPNPVPVWNIHWISNKMPRGHNQTPDEFNKQLQSEASDYFWQSVNDGKHILILIHKTVLPLAYRHLNPIVIINDPPSLVFLRKAVWNKHFGIKDNKIYLKFNNPDFYAEPMKSIVKQFNNPMFSEESFRNFYRQNIWKTPNTEFFSEQKNFPGSNFVKLSDLLDVDKLVPAIDRLCDQLNIGSIDHNYIQQAHKHWINLHTFRF